MKRKLFFLPLLFLCLLGYAQQINWNETLPTDSKVLVGKLPNGITYYLRHNEEPKERASFYIIRDAGALLENDDQNGLAHFLEHMAFNGSKNFPGNSMISTLERHGVSFGGNLNAYTTQNETVYNISSVPVTDEAVIDTCLLILHDWSYYLTLDEKDIDEERGVITEEYRTRDNSARRIQKQQLSTLLKGSQYAVRDVIGDLNVIKTFKPQTIRDFYHKWYRTDLEAIAIVGDFDVAKMEQKIKDIFSSIPAIKNPAKRPFFEIPSHEETYFNLATDKEATSSRVELVRLFRDKENDGNGTVTYQDIKNSMMRSFYNTMIANRISEIIQRGNAPFMSASIGIGGMVRGYSAYSLSTVAKPNKEKEALEAVIREHERIMQHGFTDSELERVKTNMLTSLRSALKDADKTNNEQYIQDMQSNFLEKSGMVSTEDYVAAAEKIIPTITAKEVSDQVKKWWKADNRTILVSGPSEGVTHLTEQEARDIIAATEGKAVEAYVDNAVSGSLITEDLKGSQVVETKELPQFNAVEWTLANGAKVIFRKADFEKDNVALNAYSAGGSSVYSDIDLLPAANNVSVFVNSYGLGDYDAIELQKIMTGKQAGTGISVNGLYENVSGAASPKDFETMMQMIYLRFQKPRFDAQAHDVMITRNRIHAKQMEGQPQKMMQDSLSMISTNYNPRTLLFNEAYLDKLTLDRVEKIYRDRICDASDFTFFIVGNVEQDVAKAMAEKYIGSIPSLNRHEKWIDRKVRAPKGKVEKVLYFPLQNPKSTVIVSFYNEMKYNLKDGYIVNILGNILTNRYTTSIREEQGGTYGVGVSGSASLEPVNSFSINMQFDCDPAKAAELKPLLYVEIDKVIKDGVTEEELSKVVKNALKESEQSKNHNSYWMSVLMNYYKTGVDLNDPKNYEDILKALTPKDIQDFAKKFFKNADVLDLILAPTSAQK